MAWNWAGFPVAKSDPKEGGIKIQLASRRGSLPLFLLWGVSGLLVPGVVLIGFYAVLGVAVPLAVSLILVLTIAPIFCCVRRVAGREQVGILVGFGLVITTLGRFAVPFVNCGEFKPSLSCGGHAPLAALGTVFIATAVVVFVKRTNVVPEIHVRSPTESTGDLLLFISWIVVAWLGLPIALLVAKSPPNLTMITVLLLCVFGAGPLVSATRAIPGRDPSGFLFGLGSLAAASVNYRRGIASTLVGALGMVLMAVSIFLYRR